VRGSQTKLSHIKDVAFSGRQRGKRFHVRRRASTAFYRFHIPGGWEEDSDSTVNHGHPEEGLLIRVPLLQQESLQGVEMATPWLTCARAQGMRTGTVKYI
jgi:hypothetical protein